MSDSVKKYYEDGEKNLISPEEKRELDILELISLAVKADKIATVSERAEQVQKEFKGASNGDSDDKKNNDSDDSSSSNDSKKSEA